jgi:hypothetical protein
MLSHDTNIFDRLLAILTLIWIVAVLEGKLCDSIYDGAGRWRADLPVSQTQTVLNIGVDCRSLETRRVILEGHFVLGLHLELFEQGISKAEMRVLRIARHRRRHWVEVLINIR